MRTWWHLPPAQGGEDAPEAHQGPGAFQKQEAQLLVAEGWDGRVGRLVLASCETDDNYPPGLPGRVAALAARLPGGLAAVLQPLRFKEFSAV